MTIKGLILDTSGKAAFVALTTDGILTNSHFSSSSKNSSTFLSEIKNFLEKINCPLNTLNYIAVGTGPGSFLGTRVGVILAKTLAYALKLPLLHFCSLKPYKPDFLGDYLILSDAKSKGFYALKGTQSVDGVFCDSKPILLSIEDTKTIYLSTSLLSFDKECLIAKAPFLKDSLIETTICLNFLSELCHKNYQNFSLKTENSPPLEIYYLRLS